MWRARHERHASFILQELHHLYNWGAFAGTTGGHRPSNSAIARPHGGSGTTLVDALMNAAVRQPALQPGLPAGMKATATW